MKNKTKGLLSVLIVLVMACFSIGLLACNEKTVTLTSIEIAVTPQAEYIQGEIINFDKGKIALNYSNDTFEEIFIMSNGTFTMGISVTGFDTKVVGQQTVEVSYQGFTASYPIIVYPATIGSVSIATFPASQEYFLGEKTVDVSGGKLNINYTTGIKETIDMSDSRISIQTLPNKLGEDEIEIKFTVSARESHVTSLPVEILRATSIEIVSPLKDFYSTDDADINLSTGKIKLTTTGLTRTISVERSMVTNFDLVPVYADPFDPIEQQTSKQATITCGSRSVNFDYTLTHTSLAYVRYGIWFSTGRLNINRDAFNEQFPYTAFSQAGAAPGSNLRIQVSEVAKLALEYYTNLQPNQQQLVSQDAKILAMLSTDYVEYWFNNNLSFFNGFFVKDDNTDDNYAGFRLFGTYNDSMDMYKMEEYIQTYSIIKDISNWTEEYLSEYESIRMSPATSNNPGSTIFSITNPITSLMALKQPLFEELLQVSQVAMEAFYELGSDLKNIPAANIDKAYAKMQHYFNANTLNTLSLLHDINVNGINSGQLESAEEAFTYKIYNHFYNKNEAIIKQMASFRVFPGNLNHAFDFIYTAYYFQYCSGEFLAMNPEYFYPKYISDTLYIDEYVRQTEKYMEEMKSDPMLTDLFYNLKAELFEGSEITIYELYYVVKYSSPLAQIKLFTTSIDNAEFDSFTELYYSAFWDWFNSETTFTNSQIEDATKAFMSMSLLNKYNFMVGSDIIQWSVIFENESDLDLMRFSFFEGSGYTIEYKEDQIRQYGFVNLLKYYYMSPQGNSLATYNQSQQAAFKNIFLALEEYAWLMYAPLKTSYTNFTYAMHAAIKQVSKLSTNEEIDMFSKSGVRATYEEMLDVYQKLNGNQWNNFDLGSESLKNKIAQLDNIISTYLPYTKTLSSDKLADMHFFAAYKKASMLYEQILQEAGALVGGEDIVYYLKYCPFAYNQSASYAAVLNQLNVYYKQYLTTYEVYFFGYYGNQVKLSANAEKLFEMFYDAHVITESETNLYDDALMIQMYKHYKSLTNGERNLIELIDAFSDESYKATFYTYITANMQSENAANVARNIIFVGVFYSYYQNNTDPTKVGYPNTFVEQIVTLVNSFEDLSPTEKDEIKNFMKDGSSTEGELYKAYIQMKNAI